MELGESAGVGSGGGRRMHPIIEAICATYTAPPAILSKNPRLISELLCPGCGGSGRDSIDGCGLESCLQF